MKKFHYIFIVALILLSYSCKRDLTSEGVSKVTTYVTLKMTGEHFMSIAKGTPFTEPGVTALEGTEPSTLTTLGTVDTNTAGVYTITYGATNKDGFKVSDMRIVCVYDETAASNDFSGNYARSSNQSLAEWTKIAPGMYSVFNPGGAPGTNLTIHVFNPTDNIIIVPSQVSSDGSITAATNPQGGEEITYTPDSPFSYSWVIVNAGYGTSPRNFTKQ